MGVAATLPELSEWTLYIINLPLHDMYSQSLLKCFIIIFKSIHETPTLTCHKQLAG